MRIAILVPLFPPRWLGGTEIATYNTARSLANRGHEVHVITSLDNGLPKESIVDNFRLHRVKIIRKRILRVLTYALSSVTTIRKINPDIVHAQATPTGLSPLWINRTIKKPYIVYCRGNEIYLPWLFKRMISKLVLQNADAVIALTDDMKREIEKIFPGNIFVIPNGIDCEKFEGLSREETRRNLNISKSEKVILFVGRFRPEKGVKYLLEAMSIVREKSPRARLLLVGYGEEQEHLERQITELDLQNLVTFAGKIPNEKIPQYMAASDLLVLPSLSESFGIVNLEAMASGLPIVATHVGGVPEIVIDGKNGFLVEPGNPKQIAEKVLLLLESNELRHAISIQNRKTAKYFRWEEVSQRLERIYQDAINRSG